MIRRLAPALFALFGLTGCSGPDLLDRYDRLRSNSGDYVRYANISMAGGALWPGGEGLSLDIWDRADGAQPEKRGAYGKPALRPVVIFFYGGGWENGSKDSYGFAGRAFASQGFVAVVPDYRKVPQVRFPAFVQDGAAAVAWTRANIARYGGDPDRIALVGHSAGAHIAMMLALDRRYLQAANVPDGTVKAVVGLSGPYDFYPFTSQQAVQAMQGAKPADTQPISFARKDAPPALLITGSADTSVKPHNSEQLNRALKAKGAPVTLKSYAGLGHEDIAMALSVPFRSKGTILADSAAFLNRALQ